MGWHVASCSLPDYSAARTSPTISLSTDKMPAWRPEVRNANAQRWRKCPMDQNGRQDGQHLEKGALRQAQAYGPRTCKCSPTTRRVYSGGNPRGQNRDFFFVSLDGAKSYATKITPCRRMGERWRDPLKECWSGWVNPISLPRCYCSSFQSKK